MSYTDGFVIKVLLRLNVRCWYFKFSWSCKWVFPTREAAADAKPLLSTAAPTISKQVPLLQLSTIQIGDAMSGSLHPLNKAEQSGRNIRNDLRYAAAIILWQTWNRTPRRSTDCVNGNEQQHVLIMQGTTFCKTKPRMDGTTNMPITFNWHHHAPDLKRSKRLSKTQR